MDYRYCVIKDLKGTFRYYIKINHQCTGFCIVLSNKCRIILNSCIYFRRIRTLANYHFEVRVIKCLIMKQVKEIGTYFEKLRKGKQLSPTNTLVNSVICFTKGMYSVTHELQLCISVDNFRYLITCGNKSS